MKKIVLAIAILVILGALYGWFFVYNKPHTDFEKSKPDFEVTATELYNNYVTGKGNRYNGKVLKLTGTVKATDDGDTLITLVFVFNEGMFGDEGIRCTLLPKFNPQIRKMTLPATITLKGFCAGYNGTDVVLEQCSLLK